MASVLHSFMKYYHSDVDKEVSIDHRHKSIGTKDKKVQANLKTVGGFQARITNSYHI